MAIHLENPLVENAESQVDSAESLKNQTTLCLFIDCHDLTLSSLAMTAMARFHRIYENGLPQHFFKMLRNDENGTPFYDSIKYHAINRKTPLAMTSREQFHQKTPESRNDNKW